MNRLTLEERAQIVSLLVEGSSLRSITQIMGKSINTVSKLLVDVGTALLTAPIQKSRPTNAR